MVQISEGGQVIRAVSSSLPNPVNTQFSKNRVADPVAVSGHSNNVSYDVSLRRGDVSFGSLQTRNDRFHQTATTIRAANKIMDKIGSLIEKKMFEVKEYEKQYPPFQNQSSEHIEFLNSIASLKRQVDALTLVPDNKELASIISDPFAQKEGFTSDEESAFTLPRQEIHSGENGLNIASIDTNTSNAEVHQFGRDLFKAKQTLDQKQAELQQDAKLISESIITLDEKMSVGKKMLENEQEAAEKSAEIQTRLSQLPGGSLGGEQAQKILEALK